jgi:Zn-dependent protease
MINVAVFLVSVAVATGIHEAGHTVAALLLGFRVEAVSIWPLILRRTAQSWEMAWAGFSLKSMRGYLKSYPLYSERLRVRKMGLIFAGPAASGCATVVCLWARTHLAAPKQLYNLMAEVALISFVDAVLNVVPGRKASDGGQLWALLRNKSTAVEDTASGSC